MLRIIGNDLLVVNFFTVWIKICLIFWFVNFGKTCGKRPFLIRQGLISSISVWPYYLLRILLNFWSSRFYGGQISIGLTDRLKKKNVWKNYFLSLLWMWWILYMLLCIWECIIIIRIPMGNFIKLYFNNYKMSWLV